MEKEETISDLSVNLSTKTMDAKTLYMNGEYIPAERGVISVRTHAFAYGTGIFEGIRGYWNEDKKQVYLFRLREHYERLLRSAKIMRIDLPYSVADLIEMSVELVKRNDQHEDVYMRPVGYKSDEIIGVRLNNLTDHYLLTSEPMGNYVSIGGLRCGVSSWRRIDDNAIPARAKITGSYANAAFAKTEAIQNGFDEAIMLNHEGHVSEGSAENIFLFQNGELITPAPSENILMGITRDTVIQLAKDELGLNVRERQIDRTELYTADEIFLCGTGAQIAPVVEVDHNPVGTGEIGPLGQKLQDLYFDIVRGRVHKYLDWCTPVYTGVTASR